MRQAPASGDGTEQTRFKRMKTSRWLVAFAAILLTGCGALTDLAMPPQPSLASEVTLSADGTFGIRLPAGWNDLSEDYFASRGESPLSMFLSTGDSPFDLVTPIATISTAPAVPGITAADTARAAADSWTTLFEDAEVSDEGPFTTDAGATGHLYIVEGTEDGLPTTMFVAAVVADTRQAKIFIESPASHLTDGAPERALVEALTTIELYAPTAPNTRGTVVGGMFTDGTLFADIPPHWVPQLPDDALREQAAQLDFALFGAWVLDGDQLTGTTSGYVTAGVASGVPASLDDLRKDLGAIGEPSQIEDGTITPRSYEEISLANGAVGGRACSEVARDDIDYTAEVCQYVLTVDGWEIFGSVQSLDIEHWALEEWETFLGSIAAP